MQRVHFRVRVGVFNCQQILTKISVVIFDIVVEKSNRMSFSVALVKVHWFGISWHVFMQKLSFVYYYSENRATSRIWKVLPNMVFPPFWGEKMAAFWACACKLSWTLLSPARVQPLYGAGRKESSGTGLHTFASFCVTLSDRSFCILSKTADKLVWDLSESNFAKFERPNSVEFDEFDCPSWAFRFHEMWAF